MIQGLDSNNEETSPMATATISAATLAILSLIALIIWVLVYLKMKNEHHPIYYGRLKNWHFALRVVFLTLLVLTVATGYFGLR